jgi:hypothetical protein
LPDLFLQTFVCSLKIKVTLKGRRFQTVEDIIMNVADDLKVSQQTSFEQYFQKWKRQWEQCIVAQGNYFEGDKIQRPRVLFPALPDFLRSSGSGTGFTQPR